MTDMTKYEMEALLNIGYTPVDASIEKWVRRITHNDWNIGSESCALCHVFHVDDACFGCPLYKNGDECKRLDSSFRKAVKMHNPRIMLIALHKAKEHKDE